MNEWSDAEISRRLALAIGWPEVYYHQHHDGYYVRDGSSIYFKRFDYRDPAVIWPIAERFNCFPVCSGSRWFAAVKKDIHPVNRIVLEDYTAAKAVALAVIKARGTK